MTNFGDAAELLKAGKAARRLCWPSTTFITLVPGSSITVSEGRPLAAVLPVGTRIEYLYHIDMVFKAPSGEIMMFPWVPDDESLLSGDWVEHTL